MKTEETQKLCKDCANQIPHKCCIDGVERGWHANVFVKDLKDLEKKK